MLLKMLLKKTVYNKLAAKVNHIDTSEFVLKTKYHTDKTELENKIPDVTNSVKKTKLTELENKIPDVSRLATNSALTEVENEIPNVSSLVKKQTMTQKSVSLKRNARLAQVNLITKTNFDAKLSSLNRKITSNKSKHFCLLKMS